MKKFIVTGAALVALAVPAVASADAPDGTITFNPGSGITTMDEAAASKAVAQANGDNLIAWGSSVLTHNGQFVSGKASGSPDWQHQKGSRSAQVQAELALTGQGSLTK
jgi:hypothetical protein